MKLTKAQKKALWNFCDQADHADGVDLGLASGQRTRGANAHRSFAWTLGSDGNMTH